MNLTTIFESAVTTMNRTKSAGLGNRRTYIGSSDVGSCIRKVYLSKKQPKSPDLATMLRFSRGHIAETLIENIFDAAGLKNNYDTQVEVKHPVYPLKAHIDFLFHTDLDGKPNLHIVEVKSVNGIPEEPYSQWIDQLSFQLGLLRIQYPKGKLSGSILAIDLNAGEVHQFTDFEYNDSLSNYLFTRALHMMDCLDEKEEPVPSVSLMCSYCSYRSDCPAMALPEVDLPPEIETMTINFIELNKAKRELDREMKNIRQELLDFTGPAFRGRTNAVDLIASFVEPSLIVDGEVLRKQFPSVYPDVLKERSGYTKLECRSNKSATP